MGQIKARSCQAGSPSTSHHSQESGLWHAFQFGCQSGQSPKQITQHPGVDSGRTQINFSWQITHEFLTAVQYLWESSHCPDNVMCVPGWDLVGAECLRFWLNLNWNGNGNGNGNRNGRSKGGTPARFLRLPRLTAEIEINCAKLSEWEITKLLQRVLLQLEIAISLPESAVGLGPEGPTNCLRRRDPGLVVKITGVLAKGVKSGRDPRVRSQSYN